LPCVTKKSVPFCSAEFKRSWLNDPGRAMVAVLSARLVTQIPSAITHTAIERPNWILFVNTIDRTYLSAIAQSSANAAGQGPAAVSPRWGVIQRRGGFSNPFRF
jgi:hypothetical protein